MHANVTGTFPLTFRFEGTCQYLIAGWRLFSCQTLWKKLFPLLLCGASFPPGLYRSDGDLLRGLLDTGKDAVVMQRTQGVQEPRFCQAFA